ncbi:hypothetical protein EJ110_NYTH39674 [Nymphaea thermarum]|nr:hypothetical protein EJ110_NYTH39674 [Nymphaea thermarum]
MTQFRFGVSSFEQHQRQGPGPDQIAAPAENNKSEGSTGYKMSGNSFSYGTTIKLNGSKYEIWFRVFIMSVAGHRKKYVLEDEEPIEKRGKYAAWDEDNYIVMYWIMNSVCKAGHRAGPPPGTRYPARHGPGPEKCWLGRARARARPGKKC